MPDGGRLEVGLGLLHAGDGRRPGQASSWSSAQLSSRSSATLDAAACASASAACASANSCSAFATSLLRRVDGARGRRHRLLRCRQIGTAGLHIADGGLAVREELAVAIERGDVVGGVGAELLLRRGERPLAVSRSVCAVVTRASAAATESGLDTTDDESDDESSEPQPAATTARPTVTAVHRTKVRREERRANIESCLTICSSSLGRGRGHR